MTSIPTLSDSDIVSRASSVIASCNTVAQVVNAVNWGKSLTRMQKFDTELAEKVSYTLDFLGDNKARALNAQQ